MPFDLALPLPNSDYMQVPISEADYVAYMHYILEILCGWILCNQKLRYIVKT